VSYNANNQNSAYTFDGNGNPTTYKGTSCTFDVENRMTAYGSALTSGYRGDGLRAWKQPSGGSKTYFLYDGELLACELDSSGNVSAYPTFGPAGLVSRRSGSTTTWYHFDPQGGLSQTTDASGTVTASYAWDAYGSALNGSAGVYGYGAQWGYYTDAETGLQLCTYRMYDPAVGRFVTRDPIGYSGGVNLYGYVGNGPVGASDSTGLKAEWRVVGSLPGGAYKHAYLAFSADSPAKECQGKTFGLYRRYDPPTGGRIKDFVHSPDPMARERFRNELVSSDASFEKALCNCIQGGLRFWNHERRKPPAIPIYVCGTWARDAWDCARRGIGKGDWDRYHAETRGLPRFKLEP
jgi:RHS repeat-associated protein